MKRLLVALGSLVALGVTDVRMVKATAAAPPQPAAGTVTVTLVRWPFT
jgi:hypothetical protein